ncbi:hypothetical protein ACOMHN_000579 [Nucella lapillus]
MEADLCRKTGYRGQTLRRIMARGRDGNTSYLQYQWEDVVLPLRWEVVLTIPERREASRQKTVLRETTRGSAQFVSL